MICLQDFPLFSVGSKRLAIFKVMKYSSLEQGRVEVLILALPNVTYYSIFAVLF